MSIKTTDDYIFVMYRIPERLWTIKDFDHVVTYYAM